MKQFFHFLMQGIFLFASVPLAAQQFSCAPERPMPGESLTIRFDPTGTPLAGMDFDAVAFLFDPVNSDPVAVSVSLTKENNGYTGQVKTNQDTKAVLFSFKNWQNEKEDNNGEKGYKTLLFQPDRQTAVQGAYAAKAKIFSIYGHLGGVKRDMDKAYSLMKKELELFPASKDDEKFYAMYASQAGKQNDEPAIQGIKDQINKLVSNNNATENHFLHAGALALSVKDEKWAKEISEQRAIRFPDGRVKKGDDLSKAFKAAETPADKAKIYHEAASFHQGDKSKRRLLNSWASTVAKAYAEAGDWGSFDKYLGLIDDRTSQAATLNGLAWGMSGESPEAEPKDPKKGLELSMRSLELIQKEGDEPSAMPVYYFPKRWKQEMEFSYAQFADTYALLAHHTGNHEAALQYQTIACEKNDFQDGEMNERYAFYFEKSKTPKETEDMLAKLIADGNATSKLKDQHKRLFLANNTLESAHNKLLAQLEQAGQLKKRETLKEKMIADKAPHFKLVNLKGEEVSLDGLKGKVVVVDFWATWCGPCKASFPGMQKAVDKFSKNKDVEFVFINSWENGDDKAKKAGDYIASKAFTFNVLMDTDDKTIGSFGVSGIPTKFIVDKEGIIRFKSVGFGGNDDELVTELTMMIELAGGSVPAAIPGAP